MESRQRIFLGKFRLPSWGVVVHFLIMEVVSQLLWWGASNMLTIAPIIRDIGFLVVFVAIIFAVAWYLPKLSSARPDFAKTPNKQSKKDLSISWLDGLVHEQTSQPQKYLYPHLQRLFVSSSTELGIEIEWFNCSLFYMEFVSLSGEISINRVSMGHQLKLRSKSNCDACARCTCTFDIMVDSSTVKFIQDAISKATSIQCGFLLNWDVLPSELSKPFLKPFLKQWSENNILTIPRN